MTSIPDRIRLDLPDWLRTHEFTDHYPDDRAKVELAIELSRKNVAHASGGPFGAAVFDDDDRIVAVGVNRVLPLGCSVAHAETMAFMLAQHALGRARLNDDGRRYTLATSAQPCCQCYGACFWAGIDALLIGARSEDVMSLTEFDEGPLPADWRGELRQRGIEVRTDIARDAARQVLAEYGRMDNPRY